MYVQLIAGGGTGMETAGIVQEIRAHLTDTAAATPEVAPAVSAPRKLPLMAARLYPAPSKCRTIHIAVGSSFLQVLSPQCALLPSNLYMLRRPLLHRDSQRLTEGGSSRLVRYVAAASRAARYGWVQ